MLYNNSIGSVFFWMLFTFILDSFQYFGRIFNETIIPLALAGFEMIIANLFYAPHWLCIISYPTRACGKITNIIALEYSVVQK